MKVFAPTVMPGYYQDSSQLSYSFNKKYYTKDSDRKSGGNRGHAGKVLSQVDMNFQICIFVQWDPPLLPLTSRFFPMKFSQLASQVLSLVQQTSEQILSVFMFIYRRP